MRAVCKRERGAVDERTAALPQVYLPQLTDPSFLVPLRPLHGWHILDPSVGAKESSSQSVHAVKPTPSAKRPIVQLPQLVGWVLAGTMMC